MVEEAVVLVAPVECQFCASMFVKEVEVVVVEEAEVVVVVPRRNEFFCFCLLF